MSGGDQQRVAVTRALATRGAVNLTHDRGVDEAPEPTAEMLCVRIEHRGEV